MKNRILVVLSTIMAINLTAVFPALLASKDFQTKQKGLEHDITVTLKLVQVFVTDKNGNPVMDLEPVDFELLEDGKLKDIAAFEKYMLPIFRKPSLREIEKPTPTEPLLPRKYFFLLDYDRNDGQGIFETKKSAMHFLNTKVRPGDEVGIMTYAITTGLVVLSYLTKDHDKIQNIVANIKQIPLAINWSFMSFAPVNPTLDLAETSNPFWEPRIPEIEAEKDEAKVYASMLKELAISMRQVPGSKNVILFSKGFPRSIYRDQIVKDKYHESAGELSISDTRIFSVNTSGIREVTEKRRMSNWGDHSLKDLSILSGGTYFEDVRKYDKVADLIESLTSNYYVLGYYVPEIYDGEYHNIKVRVKRKGLSVKAQKGYYNPRRFSDLSDTEKRLDLIQMALGDNPALHGPSEVSIIALPNFVLNSHALVTLAHLPKGRIQKNIGNRVEFVLVVFDQANNVLDAIQGDIDLRLLKGENVFAYSVFTLAPGEYDCRLILRDIVSGRATVALDHFIVPSGGEREFLLLSPLYMIPNRSSEFLNLREVEDVAIDTGSTLKHIYPYISNNHEPLLNELKGEFSSVLAVIPCRFAEDIEPELDIETEIIWGSTGTIVSCETFVLDYKRTKEGGVVLCEIILPDLANGEYIFKLSVTESDGIRHYSEREVYVNR